MGNDTDRLSVNNNIRIRALAYSALVNPLSKTKLRLNERNIPHSPD